MTADNNPSSNQSEAVNQRPEAKSTEIVASLESKPATEADLKKVEKEMSSFERSTLTWTRATFLVVLATGAFISLQWYEMHAGGEDTHTLAEAAKKQAEAAQIAAQTAQQALRENTEAFRLDEEARIRITSREAGWHESIPDHPLTANYRYSNVGKTPGEIIGFDKHIGVINFTPNVNRLTFEAQLPIKSMPIRVIFPGDEELISAFSRSYSTSDQEAASKGKKLIVSWGCIEYKDIFGKLHWTDFCDVRQSAPNDKVYVACSYQCLREQQPKEQKAN